MSIIYSGGGNSLCESLKARPDPVGSRNSMEVSVLGGVNKEDSRSGEGRGEELGCRYVEPCRPC